MALNQSPLLGAILAGGLAGGSIPAAPAVADTVPAAITPSEARTQAAARKRRGDASAAGAERLRKRVTRGGVVAEGRPSLAVTGVVVMHPS
jgi:hypothetical protein